MTSRPPTIAAATLLIMTLPLHATAGSMPQPLDPDPSFGGDGAIVIEIEGVDLAYQGFVEANGEIVVFGESDNGNPSNTEAIMQRIAVDGTPSTLSRFDAAAFGCSVPRIFRAAARLSGGGYVGAGYVQQTCGGIPRYMNVLELTDEGTLVDEYDQLAFSDQLAYAQAVGEQSSGRVVVGGFRSTSGFDNATYDVAVARFTTMGELDTTFGSNGTFTFDLASDLDWTDAMTIDASDRILIAGYGTNAMGNRDLLVLRLTANGALDPTFGNNGVFQFDLAGMHDSANGIAITVTGRVLVAANLRNALGESQPMVLALTDSGTLDTNFSGDGMAPIDLGGIGGVLDIVIGPAGLLYTAGAVFVGGTDPEFYDASVTVLRRDGTADHRFNGGQPQILPFDASLGLQADYPSSVALSEAGEQIVLTGFIASPDVSTYRIGVARFIGLDLIYEDNFDTQ